MKKLALLLIAFLTSTAVMAQNFPYEKASLEYLDMMSYSKDTSANALVLNQFGIKTHMALMNTWV
ncbi:hypothetical protein ACPPVU_13540 [Mucilaginibacter sp. McL0603]|uniref:hypothetical protein n=1 Tax=Mucilaginibacter sp. McL0603 TaxID=3415670 RepID=UPI003CF4392D